nr:hypothetical protein [Tanacetum cinerariifolium]
RPAGRAQGAGHALLDQRGQCRADRQPAVQKLQGHPAPDAVGTRRRRPAAEPWHAGQRGAEFTAGRPQRGLDHRLPCRAVLR